MKEFGLPEPTSENSINFDLLRELDYNVDECKEIVQTNKGLMNNQQEDFYDCVCRSIDGYCDQKLFFLDALGGTGKTFIAKIPLANIRSKGECNTYGIF